MINVAINGFGRIGRATFKAAFDNKEINIVAINDLTDNHVLAHLLKYDTVYGKYGKKVEVTDEDITIDGKRIDAFTEKDPAKLPWKDLDVDIVIESTGVFRTKELAEVHVTKAGAKSVIISAPAKGETEVGTFVLGVNEDKLEKQGVISNASCTTNCIAPVIGVLNDVFGVEKALMTTIHAYTAGQNLIDGPHKDLRRGRAAALNMLPTTTGAALATTKTIPDLENKFDGIAIRVPIAVGSISDITAILKKDVTKDDVNATFKKAAKSVRYKNILEATEDPIVSSDIVGNSHSAIIDLPMTKVVGNNMVKVLAWYDNEWGYSVRLVDMILEYAKYVK